MSSTGYSKIAFYSRTAYNQPMGLQRVPLSDFSGGLNTKDGPFNLQPNEAQDLMNVVLTERGALEQRAGKTKFNTNWPASPAIAENMRNWYPNGSSRRLMMSINGTIYSCSTGGVLTSIFAGTAGTIWSFEQAQDSTNVDFLWCLNGVDTPQKISTGGVASTWGGGPPVGSMQRLWKNRMCVAGRASFPQRLYYSDIGNPELPVTQYGTNFIDIKTTDDDEDPITWLEVIGDHLIVFKKQSVWQVFDSNSFANQRLGGPGCEGRFMSSVNEGRCYFFHRSGVWSTGGADSPVYESEAIENFITDNLNYGEIARVRVASSRDRRVFVALPFLDSDQNNRVLELVPYLRRARREGARASNGAWTAHDYNVSCMATFRPVDTDLLMGADTVSGVMRLFTGLNDNGTAIDAWWMFGWRAILGEEPFERVRRVNVEMTGRCVVSMYTDFSQGSTFSAVIETPTDADPLWNGGLWNGGAWDPTTSVALQRVRPETRGRYHAIMFQNGDLNKTFKILRGELVIRGGKEH